MKNLWLTLFNHERYQSISIILAALLLLLFYGCQPKTKSMVNPGQFVTRSELNAEIDMLIAKANIGYASLEQQERLQDLIFEQALVSASTGAVNPIALFTSIATVLGVGAVTDNVRKRKEIKKLSA